MPEILLPAPDGSTRTHRTGERRAAIDTILPAMSGKMEQNDPFWVYLRGQTWRYEAYLAAARKAVAK